MEARHRFKIARSPVFDAMPIRAATSPASIPRQAESYASFTQGVTGGPATASKKREPGEAVAECARGGGCLRLGKPTPREPGERCRSSFLARLRFAPARKRRDAGRCSTQQYRCRAGNASSKHVLNALVEVGNRVIVYFLFPGVCGCSFFVCHVERLKPGHGGKRLRNLRRGHRAVVVLEADEFAIGMADN